MGSFVLIHRTDTQNRNEFRQIPINKPDLTRFLPAFLPCSPCLSASTQRHTNPRIRDCRGEPCCQSLEYSITTGHSHEAMEDVRFLPSVCVSPRVPQIVLLSMGMWLEYEERQILCLIRTRLWMRVKVRLSPRMVIVRHADRQPPSQLSVHFIKVVINGSRSEEVWLSGANPQAQENSTFHPLTNPS